jgi:hypothetical protein
MNPAELFDAKKLQLEVEHVPESLCQSDQILDLGAKPLKPAGCEPGMK